MRIALAIATYNRQNLLEQTLAHLNSQTRAPDAIFICTPENDASAHFVTPEFIALRAPHLPPITHLTAPQGLTRQRNAILAATLAEFDVVTFIDDDFLPANNYLELVEREFGDHPNWAVLMGHVPFDGARGAGYSFEQGLALLAGASEIAATKSDVVEHVGAYGCNMSVRLAVVDGLRFDERLALYGWQEDIDFTSQLRNRGKVACPSYLIGVHLGARGGRTSGLKLGFSQIINPIYLMRKGTMPAAFGVKLMLRNVVANAARSFKPEPYIDRRGRLRGNLLALRHFVRGRIEPEHILELQ